MPSKIYKPDELIYLDTETTGLDAQIHDIIEVSAYSSLWNGKATMVTRKLKMDNPKTASPDALRVNEYSEEAWKDAVTWLEFGPRLYNGLVDKPICGHNIQFDIGFLRSTFRRLGLDASRIGASFVDTMELAARILSPRGLPNKKLATVSTFLGISADNAHHASYDVWMCVQIYQKLHEMTNGNLGR